MSAYNEKALEAAGTAPKAKYQAPEKLTLVHNAPDRHAKDISAIGLPVFECVKPGGVVLRVQFETFGKTTYLDIRQWSDWGKGLSRTSKGATVPLEHVRQLGEALCRLALPEPPQSPDEAS